MKKYKVKIEPEALTDIQDITNWYNLAQAGLGERFLNTTIRQINSLNKAPRFMLSGIMRSGAWPLQNSPTWFIFILLMRTTP